MGSRHNFRVSGCKKNSHRLVLPQNIASRHSVLIGSYPEFKSLEIAFLILQALALSSRGDSQLWKTPLGHVESPHAFNPLNHTFPRPEVLEARYMRYALLDVIMLRRIGSDSRYKFFPRISRPSPPCQTPVIQLQSYHDHIVPRPRSDRATRTSLSLESRDTRFHILTPPSNQTSHQSPVVRICTTSAKTPPAQQSSC